MEHEFYCSTCGSCGEPGCCPPTRCKFGLSYIKGLNEEIAATRKALAAYIKKAGYEPTEEVINQEIDFYGSR